jgi:hypothetical protein
VSKAPSDFKQTNVKRLCRAVLAAGIPIGRVEYDKASGNINVYPAKPGEKPIDPAVSEWDSTA